MPDSKDHPVTENQDEIEQNMPPVADHEHNVTRVTFVDDSEVAVVAVCEMTDLPVQEDEYDTDSESDREDDTPPDITVTRSGQAIRAHFRLDLISLDQHFGAQCYPQFSDQETTDNNSHPQIEG